MSAAQGDGRVVEVSKRIGVVTFQDGLNYGAVLQAMATCKMLRQRGHQAEVIRYTPIYHYLKEFGHFLLLGGRIFRNLAKMRAFDRYKSSCMSSRRLSRNRLGLYDAVFFGADEIWNVHNESFPFDPHYLGESFPEAIKIAHAPSFGSTTELTGDNAELFRNHLRNFSHIVPRDCNSRAIVDSLGFPGPITLDPVLLPVEFPEHQVDEWRDRPYRLIYAPPGHFDEGLLVQRLRDQGGPPIVAIGWDIPQADASYPFIGPGEWLWLFRNAQQVHTSMFHGVCFAVKLARPFTALVTPYRRNKLSSFDQLPEVQADFVESEDDFATQTPADYDRQKVARKAAEITEARFNDALEAVK